MTNRGKYREQKGMHAGLAGFCEDCFSEASVCVKSLDGFSGLGSSENLGWTLTTSI